MCECVCSVMYDAQARQIEPARHPARADVEAERLARGGERGESADRRGVVDDSVEGVGQAEHPAQPAERDVFELGRGGRGAPEHRVDVERRGERFGEDGHRRGTDREVREEPRVIPVRDPRHHVLFEVGEDPIERLALDRRFVRQRVDQVARLRAREHRVPSRLVKIVVDPRGDTRERVAKRRIGSAIACRVRHRRVRRGRHDVRCFAAGGRGPVRGSRTGDAP